MKARNICRNDNLILTKSETDTSTRQKHIRPKKQDNSFFNKSFEILKSCKNIFTQPANYTGNAEENFKQSLRNYDDFEVTKTYKWAQKFLSNEKSLESLKTSRKASAPKFGEGDTKLSGKHKKKKQLKRKASETAKLKQQKPKQEESEHEEFFSPIGELAGTYAQPTIQLNVEESEQGSDKEFIMADEEMQDIENLMERVETEVDGVIYATQEDKSYASEDLQGISEGYLPGITEDAEQEDITEASEHTENASEEEATTEQEDIETEAEDNLKLKTVETALEADAEEQAPEVTVSTADTEKEEGIRNVHLGDDAKSYDPHIDSSLFKELEEAEKQAIQTVKIVYELKKRVAELLSKPKMSPSEAKELEQKNRLLSEQMNIFEAKTKRIQCLIHQTNLYGNVVSPRPCYKEDVLPKVIICGITENNIPKIIVCDDRKKGTPCAVAESGVAHQESFALPPQISIMPQFAKRLNESYYMQEKLAAENADLEEKRYQLQEDLLDKDQTVESLQRTLQCIQGELRMVCKENCLLSDKLQRIESCPVPCSQLDSDEYEEELSCKKHSKKRKMPCGKDKGPCPADVEARLQGYSETTQQLEKQLCDMENQVHDMQSELVAVQKERRHLEQHRRMLNPPSAPSATCPPPVCAPSPPSALAPCALPPCSKPPCPGPCNPIRGSEQQLRELREQYNRLEDDYKGKLTEVAGLRADTEKCKQIAKDAEESKRGMDDKVKELERELRNYRSDKDKLVGSKELLIEQEQQLNVAKQRFREAQDELEELRALIQDQHAQLDDYRNKYLQAQQQVEEQRRQIDLMEMENNRISEQVNLEIQRVKNQFQEKLQELTPLPDILKATQLKLQEAQQMHLLAERNNETMCRELQAYRNKAAAMADQMERVRSDQQLGADEKATTEQRAKELESKCNQLEEDNNHLKTELTKMEETAEQNEKRVQEKLHEIAQLVSQLETVREESARQVARTKDRCETVRRSMQNQIADLERQLAQSRAQARSAQKDRDDIRQKMQSQINNLNDNFEDAKMRIRNLQGHVNFLKTSYTNVFPSDGMVSDPMDACDCGNTY